MVRLEAKLISFLIYSHMEIDVVVIFLSVEIFMVG